MLTIKKFIFAALILLVGFATQVHAHCPVCTAAVGAAAISAKYYGMDTSVIGLLIGAFAVSTGLWIGLRIRHYFKFQMMIIVILSFILTVVPVLYIINDTFYVPLLFFGPSGTIFNKAYWVNKILFGSIFGGLITLLAYFMHVKIKKMHGKVIFPFQGVVLTLVFLLASGLSLYFVFR